MTRKIGLLFLSLFSIQIVHADNQPSEGMLNRLLAPGPLMEGHKEMEGKDCLKCHEVGKGISEEKCLACHKTIRAAVISQKGFHGLTKETCITCHGDHRGRSNDTTSIDEKKFDHRKTGYPLEGKHSEVRCSECHKNKRTKKQTRQKDTHYFGNASSCLACHKKDDVHHFTGKWAKAECSQCHGLKTWKDQIRFDHTVDGHYELQGKHEKLKCDQCHKKGKYTWPNLKKAQCLSCHADFHKDNLSAKFRGGDCAKCHTQNSWKMSAFKHEVTGYILRGKHAELKCNECHKPSGNQKARDPKNIQWAGLKQDCLSCHKDFHRFAEFKSKELGNLNQCLGCHIETNWKEIHNFNHSVNTRFPIEGKHIGLSCQKCHLPQNAPPTTPGNYHWKNLETNTCASCHKNPHVNDPSPSFKEKKCDACHLAEGWNVFNKGGEKFDHDKTRFKLTDRHAELQCAACHVQNKKQKFRFEHVEQEFCIDCHKNQHVGQFHTEFSSKACAECHTTRKFTERHPFDHDQTQFPLKNKHSKLKCEECHKVTKEMFETRPPHPKSQFIFPNLKENNCTQCHNDFHAGQLGNQCSTCHSDVGWKKTNFDHSTQSRFALKGKHEDVKCAKCHKFEKDKIVEFSNKRFRVVHYKPISPECLTCHKDPHRGHFGLRCQECHKEVGWKITKDFHRNFSLTGVHYSLQCQECHRDNRKLTGMSQTCTVCHQKDDVHQGSLPQCGNCHKQQFWENADFKHSLSLFPLRGAHRSLECSSCHSTGIYQGTPFECVSCHLADASSSNVHPNPLPNFRDCKSCHNQFTF